jgi:hypothetical protein
MRQNVENKAAYIGIFNFPFHGHVNVASYKHSFSDLVTIGITLVAARPRHAATPSILNTAEPTIVPTPMSDSVMNVPTILIKNSGDDVAIAMNVAPATSSERFRSVNTIEEKILLCAKLYIDVSLLEMSEKVYLKIHNFQMFSALFYIGIDADVPQLQICYYKFLYTKNSYTFLFCNL